ncbi:MAG: hemolysin family protein [Candidatus Izemoplasmataceae bacterium]
MDLSDSILAVSDIPPASFIVLIILLFFSGFFSMSETVFSSLNPIRLKHFIEDHRKGAKRAFWIHARFDYTLTTILVGNNLVNVALATISASIFSQIFVDSELMVTLFNTGVMTAIILIFGEIIPKSFGKMHADTMALRLSGPLYFFMRLLYPITWFFMKIRKLFLRQDNRVTISVSEDELETIIDTMEEEGSIDEDEAEMLQSVLDLGEKKVYEIMTPRVDMVSVEVDEPIESIQEKFFENQLSRLPVYEKDRDHVVGILTERDFFTSLIKGKEINIKELMKPPVFVSKSMRADTLIETLQRENSHLAIVSDEFGGTSGIATMEDALEELVGEIYDEHDDIDDEFLKQISDKEYGVNADIELGDLFDQLELGDPPDSPERNLGSWLFEQFEKVPEVDMTHTIRQKLVRYDADSESPTFDLTFIIKEIRERRIKYVHLYVDEVDPDQKENDKENANQ